MIDESMKTVTTQSAFFCNDANKTKLITMLVKKFKDKDIKTRQAIADRLIVETAFLETGLSHPVVVIRTDTDILVMLTSLAPAGSDMYMLCSANPQSPQHNTHSRSCWQEESTPALYAFCDRM